MTLAENSRITQSDMAFKFIQGIKRGNKEGREHRETRARVKAKIQCFTLEIGRRILLDIFGNAIECWIPLADQRPAGMIDKSAKIKSANVIYPFCGSARFGYDIFAIGVIKITIFHDFLQ